MHISKFFDNVVNYINGGHSREVMLYVPCHYPSFEPWFLKFRCVRVPACSKEDIEKLLLQLIFQLSHSMLLSHQLLACYRVTATTPSNYWNVNIFWEIDILKLTGHTIFTTCSCTGNFSPCGTFFTRRNSNSYNFWKSTISWPVSRASKCAILEMCTLVGFLDIKYFSKFQTEFL